MKSVLLGVLIGALLSACVALAPSMGSTVLLTDGSGHGSGVVIGEGLILTAAHVGNADNLTARFEDGSESQSTRHVEWYSGNLPAPDLGLVWADTLGHPVVTPRCTAVIPGERITITGQPFVLRWATTTGTVATLRPLEGNGQTFFGPYYLADATIMPGSSGGPAFDEDGLLVGIVTAQVTLKAGSAFAVIQSPEGICAFLEAHGVL